MTNFQEQQQQQQSKPIIVPDEYVAVILATTVGNRLEPLTITNTTNVTSATATSTITTGTATTATVVEGNTTSTIINTYKHLLPIAGVPCIVRLLYTIQQCNFNHCIIIISQNDSSTYNTIINCNNVSTCTDSTTGTTITIEPLSKQQQQQQQQQQLDDNDNRNNTDKLIGTILFNKKLKVSIFQLGIDTTTTTSNTGGGGGSIEALRRLVQYSNNNNNSNSNDTTGSNINNNNANTGTTIDTNTSTDTGTRVTTTTTSVLVSPISNIVLFPGDFFVSNPLYSIIPMIHKHRSSTSSTSSSNNSNSSTGSTFNNNNNNIMMLLANIEEYDDNNNGIPLKNSSKLKKGIGLPIDDTSIDNEYIALQQQQQQQDTFNTNTSTTSTTNKVIWKQSKSIVEEDIYMDGTTPKVILPKHLLYNTTTNNTATTSTTIYSGLLDVHVYILPPWVHQGLIQYRCSNTTKNTKFHSIQQHLIQLLIQRQLYGIVKTFKMSSSKKALLSNTTTTTSEIQKTIHNIQYQQQYYYPTLHSMIQPQPQHQQPLSIKMQNNNNVDDKNNNSSNDDDNSNKLYDYNDTYSVLSYTVPKTIPVVASSSSSSSTTSPQGVSLLIARISTLQSYMYIQKEISHQLSATSYLLTTSIYSRQQQVQLQQILQNLFVPTGTAIKSRFHSLLLSNASTIISPTTSNINANDTETAATTTSVSTTGTSSSNNTLPIINDKVTYKLCIIGCYSIIGTKCKLNNVIVYNNCTIHDNCTIQNSIVGTNVTIGTNCTLNDCYIASNCIIPSNTKLKNDIIDLTTTY